MAHSCRNGLRLSQDTVSFEKPELFARSGQREHFVRLAKSVKSLGGVQLSSTKTRMSQKCTSVLHTATAKLIFKKSF